MVSIKLNETYVSIKNQPLTSTSSVGVDADEEKLSKVISELSGKNIDDVLAEGKNHKNIFNDY